MSQSRQLIPGQKYRHFKGNLYQIITIGYHSETNEEMVVYQALYGDFKVYIRPLHSFLEPVDSEKYPDAVQTYRFELEDKHETIEKNNTGKADAFMEAEGTCGTERTYGTAGTYGAERTCGAAGTYGAERICGAAGTYGIEETSETKAIAETEEKGVNPLLIRFLEAETYTDKLKIYLDMRDSIDEVILTDVAASLDIATGDGTLEEQYESVQYALHTLARYERNKRE